MSCPEFHCADCGILHLTDRQTACVRACILTLLLKGEVSFNTILCALKVD